MLRRHLARRGLTLAAVALFGLAGCRAGSAEAPVAQHPAPAKTGQPVEAAPARSPFDGARAFEHVRRQVAFGPRPAGSPQLAETRKYLKGELVSYGLVVHEEPFTAETPVGKIEMVNLVGELPGASPDVLVLGSHYDTKRMKDFVGANDGGSSTAALLEIARVLAEEHKTKKPDLTLQFVFFDGEEAVVEWTDTDSVYGSTHFVDSRETGDQLERVRAMVLLDMIGDKDLAIQRELNSTRELTDVIWQTAASLGYARHFPNTGHYIEDDHKPFLEAGVPAVDLIDFSYGPQNGFWHTPADTLDKVSPESLKVVGDVILASVPKIIALVKKK
jgi:hypothetical protein